MTMNITMLQTRMGEAGALLLAGSTNLVSDSFGAAMVGAGYANDTCNALVPDQSSGLPHDRAASVASLPDFSTWSPSTSSAVLAALSAIYSDGPPVAKYQSGTGAASSSGTTVTVDSTAGLKIGMRPMILLGAGTFNNVAPNSTLVTSITSATQFVISVAPSVALAGATIWASTIPVALAGVSHGEAANAWEGGVCMPNGSVVLNPVVSSNVGLYDPVSLVYSRGPRNPNSSTSSGTLGPDGRVYFGNQAATNYLRYDPNTGLLATVVAATTGFCGGMVQVPDGRLVAVPVTQASVDVINVYTNTKTTVAHGQTLGGGTGFFSSGTVWADGRVFMAPWGSNVPRVGIFDPVTNTFALGASCVTDAAINARYEGAVVMRSGNILMVPNRATRIGVYSPGTDTWRDGPAHLVDVSALGAFSGGTLMPDGRVLMFPRSQPHYGIYDETDDTFLLGPLAPGTVAANMFIGGVLTPSGNTVAAGVSTQISVVALGQLPAAVAAMCTHPLYNKQ